MPEKDRTTSPGMGSNEPGEETTERRSTGISEGSDTQTKIAAISAQKNKEEDQALKNAKQK